MDLYACLWPTAKNFRSFVVVIALSLVIGITGKGHTLALENLGYETPPNPTVEFVKRAEIIWEIPEDPKAVLFLAHGCGGSARNFWVRCPSCPNCVGLPEESQIVRDALARKYAVLVVSSHRCCWTYEKEMQKTASIIRWWLQNYDLAKLPLFGLGASSGGYFLSILATNVRFQGIVVMIASGLHDQMGDIPPRYPPTLFVHMPKDLRRVGKIHTNIRILRNAGVEADEIKCEEVPITPEWLATRIPGLDRTISSKIFEALRDKGHVDDNGYLKKDGRVTPWRKALWESNITLPYDSSLTQYIEKYIQEELNLAYGYHEMTSLPSKEIFEWFDSHINGAVQLHSMENESDIQHIRDDVGFI